jgi:hypothetical protein
VRVCVYERYQEQDALARRQVRGTEDREGPTGLITMLLANPLNSSIVWRVSRALREHVVAHESVRTQCLSAEYKVDEVLMGAILLYKKQSLVLAQTMRLLATLAYGNDLVCMPGLRLCV